jgi:hypothetical protein
MTSWRMISFKTMSGHFKLMGSIMSGQTTKPVSCGAAALGTIFGSARFCMNPIAMIEEFQQIIAASDASIVHVTNFDSTVSHLASNPRDKIYAVPGFAQSGLVPNYQATVKDIYVEFACRYLRHHDVLSLLRFAGIGHAIENQFALPSWVPDWHGIARRSDLEVLDISNANADRNIQTFRPRSTRYFEC